MSTMSIEEAIKNEKIAELLENVIEIEKEIAKLPDAIKSELSSLTYSVDKLTEITTELKNTLSFYDILVSKLTSFNRVILIYNIIFIFLLTIILLLTIFNK